VYESELTLPPIPRPLHPPPLGPRPPAPTAATAHVTVGPRTKRAAALVLLGDGQAWMGGGPNSMMDGGSLCPSPPPRLGRRGERGIRAPPHFPPIQAWGWSPRRGDPAAGISAAGAGGRVYDDQAGAQRSGSDFGVIAPLAMHPRYATRREALA